MKIAIIGSKAYDSLEYHTVDALKALGHETYHVDISDFLNLKYIYNYWICKFSSKYADLAFGNLAGKIIDYKPDLVICTYRFIPKSAINKIKNNLKSAVLVQLNPDAITTFEKQQIFESPYDHYFTKDPFILNFMKNKANLNAHYLPEAFNQRVHKIPKKDRIILEENVDIDVLVFGSLYPYRINLVKQLIKTGIKVSLYGSKQFNDQELNGCFRNEWITGERKSEILVGSKIVFNNFHYAEIESVNCKFFEIAGCGAFQICDYKPVIEDYSLINADKFTFKNTSEAIDKISYYLKNPEMRYELAQKQREHFLEFHTYDVRVQKMLEIIYK